jgi:Uma2 family endonuclease
MTVAEFEKIPNPPGGKYELRNGELVLVSFPPKIHQQMRRAVFLALYRLLGTIGYVDAELAFRPTHEHNEWSADVGFVTRERWDSVGDRQWLAGAPDLVAEVLSPSSTGLELNEREAVCLANGCRQFWLVDANLKIVKVSTPDRRTIRYAIGDDIDLAEFGGGKLSVSEIFGAQS